MIRNRLVHTKTRNPRSRVEELTIDRTPTQTQDQNLLRITYSGWRILLVRFQRAAETDSISANHSVSSPFDGLPQPKGGPDAYVEELSANGIDIWPFPVPVTAPSDPVDFGFNFSAPNRPHQLPWPSGRRGRRASRPIELEHDGSTHAMADGILRSTSATISARRHVRF